MTWAYRIIHHNKDSDESRQWYGLHELHYTPNGLIDFWSKEPCTFISKEKKIVNGISYDLAKALIDVSNEAVLSEKALPGVFRAGDKVKVVHATEPCPNCGFIALDSLNKVYQIDRVFTIPSPALCVNCFHVMPHMDYRYLIDDQNGRYVERGANLMLALPPHITINWNKNEHPFGM